MSSRITFFEQPTTYLPLAPTVISTATFSFKHLKIRKSHELLRMQGANHRNGINYPSLPKSILYGSLASTGFRLLYEIKENYDAVTSQQKTVNQAICDTLYDSLSNGLSTALGIGIAESILKAGTFGLAMSAGEIVATGLLVTAIGIGLTCLFDHVFQAVKENELKNWCGRQQTA